MTFSQIKKPPIAAVVFEKSESNFLLRFKTFFSKIKFLTSTKAPNS